VILHGVNELIFIHRISFDDGESLILELDALR